MRKFLLVTMFLGCMFCGSRVFAKGADVLEVSTCAVVNISSFTWTAIPSTTTVDTNRIGIIIDMDNATTNYMYLILSSSAAPTDATGKGFKYYESDPPWMFPINKDVNLFGVMSGGAANKPVYIQQIRGNF